MSTNTFEPPSFHEAIDNPAPAVTSERFVQGEVVFEETLTRFNSSGIFTEWGIADIRSQFGSSQIALTTGDADLDGLSGVRAFLDSGNGSAITINYSLKAVPVPGAVWLFLSGMVFLFGNVRKT